MGVADLLASVANAPASPEPEEASEETKPTADGEESAPADGGESDEDSPAEETDSALAAEDEAGRLRQEDYTRKTQALAEERKALKAEIEAEREEFSKKEEEFGEVANWLRGLNDPDQAEYQLTLEFPQTMAALKAKWIAEAGEESQLTERERAMRERVRQLEYEQRARKEEEDRAKARHEKAQKAARSAELRKQVDGWMPAAAKAVGLDQDEDTYRLIYNELGNGNYFKVRWTQDVITQAAKAVAKALKKGAPPPAAPPKPPPSPKGTGHKAPANAAAKKTKPKQDLGNFFDRIRDKYNAN